MAQTRDGLDDHKIRVTLRVIGPPSRSHSFMPSKRTLSSARAFVSYDQEWLLLLHSGAIQASYCPFHLFYSAYINQTSQQIRNQTNLLTPQ